MCLVRALTACVTLLNWHSPTLSSTHGMFANRDTTPQLTCCFSTGSPYVPSSSVACVQFSQWRTQWTRGPQLLLSSSSKPTSSPAASHQCMQGTWALTPAIYSKSEHSSKQLYLEQWDHNSLQTLSSLSSTCLSYSRNGLRCVRTCAVRRSCLPRPACVLAVALSAVLAAPLAAQSTVAQGIE